MKNLNLGFVGLSHLGLSYLAASVQMKYNVLGIDEDKDRLNQLKEYKIIYNEPLLKEIIQNNKKKINFSDKFEDLRKCQIVFISEDIKTDKNGNSDYRKINKLIKNTIKVLNKKAVLIILSQVIPGFTRKVNFDKTRLYYQVETLIFGNAIKRALKPERIIVGCIDPKKKINNNLKKYLSCFKSPVLKMTYESAELTKISINMFLTSTISTTNMLSSISSKISADWNEIIPALKLDERIGQKAYLKPGLGISGGNLERDISTLKKILKKNKEPLSMVNAFKKNSEYAKSWVYRILKKEGVLKKNSHKVGLLGLAYKTNTNSIKNSPSIVLLKKIFKTECYVYDPVVKLSSSFRNCTQVKNIKKIIDFSNVIILMTPWQEFKKLNLLLNNKKKQKTILIDPFGMIQRERIKRHNIKYFTLGKHI